jgi:hypothetical protein
MDEEEYSPQRRRAEERGFFAKAFSLRASAVEFQVLLHQKFARTAKIFFSHSRAEDAAKFIKKYSELGVLRASAANISEFAIGWRQEKWQKI